MAVQGHWTGWQLVAAGRLDFTSAARTRQAGRELPTPYDAIAEIHARWLMTPRDDLQGCTPRDVLLAKRRHIDWDLQDRGHQWSFVRQCPPGISRDSAAYRICGFGSHENYMYYDLARHLLGECWDRIVQPSEDAARTELYRPEIPGEELLDQLRKSQQEWLHAPIEELMSRETPAKVIDLERRRVPLAMQGEAAMIDCDCPMCQMMATPDFGPMFCHFDGCNNDPESTPSRTTPHGEWRGPNSENTKKWTVPSRKRGNFAKQGCCRTRTCSATSLGHPRSGRRAFGAETEHESPVLAPVRHRRPSRRVGDRSERAARRGRYVEPLNRYFGNVRAALEEPEARCRAGCRALCLELAEAAAMPKTSRKSAAISNRRPAGSPRTFRAKS